MSIFAYDKTCVNPTPETLRAMCDAAVEVANRGARTRTVAPFGNAPIDEYAALSPTGWYESDGGCVPNGYGYRAETSVLALVWFTTPDGNRHVRVVGGRISAPKRPYGSGDVNVLASLKAMESGRTSYPELVYPALHAERVAKSKRRKNDPEELALLDACVADPLDLVARSALADWNEERGYPTLAADYRKAVALIEKITSPATV